MKKVLNISENNLTDIHFSNNVILMKNVFHNYLILITNIHIYLNKIPI